MDAFILTRVCTFLNFKSKALCQNYFNKPKSWLPNLKNNFFFIFFSDSKDIFIQFWKSSRDEVSVRFNECCLLNHSCQTNDMLLLDFTSSLTKIKWLKISPSMENYIWNKCYHLSTLNVIYEVVVYWMLWMWYFISLLIDSWQKLKIWWYLLRFFFLIGDGIFILQFCISIMLIHFNVKLLT